MIIETYSEEETLGIAEAMARDIKSSSIICLDGDLGTGKSVFARGFARGLGITEPITSPTFTLVQIHEGDVLNMYHFDVYRIDDPSQMYDIGYEDYFYSDGVCLVEWASLIKELIPDYAIWVSIEKDISKGYDYRKITIKNQ